MTRLQLAIDTMRHQLAQHGVHITDEAARDAAAHVVMVLDAEGDEPQSDTRWRPADASELDGHEHGRVFDATDAALSKLREEGLL